MVKQLSRVLAVLGTAAFVVLTSGAAAAPQHRSSTPVEPQPRSVYYVEVEFADGVEHDTVLACPDGGAHPHGAEVCEQLTAVNGEVGALAPTDSMCTMDYRPVVVRAHGLWDGSFRSYQGQFGNHCVALDRTGGQLFDIVPR